MTTIPNLNIVIQQGDTVKDLQNLKNTVLDSSQLAANERMEEENRKRTAVRQPDETEQVLFNKEKPGGEKRRAFQKKMPPKKAKENNDNKDPDATGRLLDTIV
jgi:hypothetical protein